MKVFEIGINIEVYLILVVLINRIIAGLFAPILGKLKLDKIWLMYVSWVFAGYIIFTTGLNLFADMIPDLIVGQILTAIAVGGGANILHDATDQEINVRSANGEYITSTPDAQDR